MADHGSKGSTVLVTGGSGFLGQHVIKLLNTHADHVTSIRVVDLVPFINKLDYKATKSIRSYVGNIMDDEFMRKTMAGCDSVIHLAGFADPSMFPDDDKIKEVNVKGTMVPLQAAQNTAECQRFIGCGSMSAFIDTKRSVTNGNEETPVPSSFMFGQYASAKNTCQRLVMAANCTWFQTVYIHPVLMYGELDDTYMPVVFQSVVTGGGTMYPVNCGNTHQHAYVGNVAWAFVCADKHLYEEHGRVTLDACTDVDMTSHTRQSDTYADDNTSQSSKLRHGASVIDAAGGFLRGNYVDTSTNELETVKRLKQAAVTDGRVKQKYRPETIDGQVFIIADDTPDQNIFKFQEQFVKACGFKVSKFTLPFYLISLSVNVIYFVLLMFSCFGFKTNISVSISSIQYLNKTNIFSYEKAANRMGYSPLYSPAESYERSLRYYKNVFHKK